MYNQACRKSNRGSILGPVLFILYTNDIDDCLENLKGFFADGSAIHYTHKLLKDLYILGKNDNLEDWFTANKWPINNK